MIFRFCIAFLVCVPLFYLGAQTDNIRFNHLSTDHGLSNNDARAILQDSKGFLWFGTLNGLNKFDGYTFTVYKHEKDNIASLCGNTIDVIDEDTDDNLWVVTNASCLSKLHLPDHSIKRYYLDSLSEVEINDVYVNGSEIWVGYYGGIGKYNKLRDRFDLFELRREDDQLNVTSITHMNDSMLILAVGNDDRLVLFNKMTTSHTFYTYRRTLNPAHSNGNERKLLLNDGEGNIWVGALGHGVYKLMISENNVILYSENNGPFRLSSNNIRSLHYNKSSGELWVGTDGGGLNIINTRTDRGYIYRHDDYDEYSLSSMNGIYSIYQDRNNIIWLGLYNGGINYYNQNQKKFYSYTHNPQVTNSISNKSVMCLHQDTEGRVWVGTDGGGLNEFYVDKGLFRGVTEGTAFDHVKVVASIEDSGEDHLLLGTWDNGLYLFNKRTQALTPVPLVSHCNRSISNRSAWDIQKVSEDTYWIATIDGGLNVYNHRSHESAIQNRLIKCKQHYKGKGLDARVLYMDSEKNLWVGTNYNGVTKIDLTGGESVTYLSGEGKSSIASNDIKTILEDHKGNLWFGTRDNGISRLDKATKKFSSLTVADGLPDHAVQSILEDNKGNLWFSSSRGLTKYIPDTKTFVHFDKSDGLPGNEFKYNAALKLKDGRLIFGSAQGLCVFNPDSIHSKGTELNVVFTDFYLFNKIVKPGDENSPLSKSINYQSRIELDHRQSSFTIGFSSLNFVASERNQYAYKMEGFDEDWNYVTAKHEATYTNIPPGQYLFKVKASDLPGRWNTPTTSLDIIINPPWWKTNTAFIIYFIMSVFLLFLFRRMAIAKERSKNVYENSLNKLRLLSNVSHDLKTPLSLIREPVEELLQLDSKQSMAKRHENYLLIHRSVQRMVRIVNQLMYMAREENHAGFLPDQTTQDLVSFIKQLLESFRLHARERKIHLDFTAKFKILPLTFSETHLENILYNLLSNAFKFTCDNGKINVKLRLLNKEGVEVVVKEDNQCFIEIIVKDNGIGISRDKVETIFDGHYSENNLDKWLDDNSGLGLSIIKELVEMYNGTICVESEEQNGSEFVVSFPILNGILGEEATVNANSRHHFSPAEYVMPTCTEKERDNSEAKKPLLLIVEDDIEFRLKLVKEFACGYRLVDAQDGDQALEKIRMAPPDLVISDIKLPKLNGLELCRTIKSRLATSHIPVILLTGSINYKNELNSIEHGADRYIEKPFNFQLLKAQVKNLLEGREQLRLKFQSAADISPENFTSNKIDENFLNELISYIHENITDSKINAAQLTKTIGMSRSLLYRKLKELTGESVNSFVSNIRIKKSIQLLAKGHSISETAHLVGFSSYSYFVRSFQKQLGESPGAYLKSLKRKNLV